VLEDVFSSSSSGTGFRIRAAQGRAADHGLSDHGFASWAERVAATLFFTLFPPDCRICGSPLLRVSRLPVCETCLIALTPLQGSYCTVCGEALHVPACAGAARVWVATVARTLKLKISDVITLPENISEQGVKIASA